MDDLKSGTSGTSGTSETMPPSGISGTSGWEGTAPLLSARTSGYDTDDPNKLQLSWSNVNTWLVDSHACSTAVEWVQSKITDLEKVKTDVEKTGTYNMDSSVYALEQFIVNKNFQWAEWFIVQIMLETEYKAYVTYAITQLPEKFDKKNLSLLEAVELAKSCAKNAMDNRKPSAARKAVEYVILSNALHNPTMNTDDVLVIILNYGVDLIKQRKL